MRNRKSFSRAFFVGLALALSAGIFAGGLETGGGVKNVAGSGGGVKNKGKESGGGVKNVAGGGDTGGGGVKNVFGVDDTGGGGVKNVLLRDLFGGVGVSCLDGSGIGVELMDLREARLQPGAVIERTDDYAAFHARVAGRLRRAAGKDPQLKALAERIVGTATAFGRAESGWSRAWSGTRRNFTLLSEYGRKEGALAWVDHAALRASFAPGSGRLAGCTLYQISWFARFATGFFAVDRPVLFLPNADELDGFNLRVLELHESVFAVATQDYDSCGFDPAPSRELVGAAIRGDLEPSALAEAMRTFRRRCGDAKAFAPLIEWKLDGGTGR